MAYLINVRYVALIAKVPSLLFRVGLLQPPVGGLRECGPWVGGYYALVFFNCEVALPQNVIDLASSQIRLLQDFCVGLRSLMHLPIGRDRTGVVFLAAKQVPQAER